MKQHSWKEPTKKIRYNCLPASGQSKIESVLLRALSKCLLSTGRHGASTTLLGSVFQCLTTPGPYPYNLPSINVPASTINTFIFLCYLDQYLWLRGVRSVFPVLPSHCLEGYVDNSELSCCCSVAKQQKQMSFPSIWTCISPVRPWIYIENDYNEQNSNFSFFLPG